MALPDRFRTATFEEYEAGTSSQAEALRAAREFVRACRQSPSWTEHLKQLLGRTETSRPNGLYLVGPAGTGKTHLLAAVYNALTPAVSCAFLHSSTLFRQTVPPTAFAHRLADEHAVCCLDEVEIDDPANEMRLVQVLQTLAERGVPLLATSNVTPEQYLSRQFSETRFERFLHREFRADYRIVFVEGPDYRRTQEVEQSGHGWIGPSDQTQRALRRAYEEATGASRWWSFSDLRRATTEIAHPTLIDDLTTLDRLFVADISIANTDDALRLLRVIDALYLNPDAPALHFTAERPPDAWFDPDAHAGVAQAVAEKFGRTVSRLHALCDIRPVESVEPSVSNIPPETDG
ncbi:MAG: cell division protein ZapE [Bacteroidetes bacterium QH_7_62_13]|nr:MAG: cell division protein ZapE [Bacteroidetes bacterium QH_7_62_13]